MQDVFNEGGSIALSSWTYDTSEAIGFKIICCRNYLRSYLCSCYETVHFRPSRRWGSSQLRSCEIGGLATFIRNVAVILRGRLSAEYSPYFHRPRFLYCNQNEKKERMRHHRKWNPCLLNSSLCFREKKVDTEKREHARHARMRYVRHSMRSKRMGVISPTRKLKANLSLSKLQLPWPNGVR